MSLLLGAGILLALQAVGVLLLAVLEPGGEARYWEALLLLCAWPFLVPRTLIREARRRRREGRT